MSIGHHQIGQGTLREYRVGILVQASVALSYSQIGLSKCQTDAQPAIGFSICADCSISPLRSAVLTAAFSLIKIFRIRRALMNHLLCPV